jgi:hypothetical protein
MMTLLVQIAAALFISVPAIWLSKRLEKSNPVTLPPKQSKKSRQPAPPPTLWGKIRPYAALGVVPIATVLSTAGINMINDIRAAPEVDVKIDNKTKNTEVSLTVMSSKYLESLAIDIPILGKFRNVQDMNSITDGKTTIKRYFAGDTKTSSQINIEFYIEDLKPERKLDFKVFYEPAPPDMFVAGTDRYKISYSWPHGGNQLTAVKWISLKTGAEVEEPPRVWGVVMQDKPFTQEDINKLYEEGTKRQNLGR